VVPLAKALIAANPERIIWGSDGRIRIPPTPPGTKPTDVTLLYQIDDGRLFNQLPYGRRMPRSGKRYWSTIRLSFYGF